MGVSLADWMDQYRANGLAENIAISIEEASGDSEEKARVIMIFIRDWHARIEGCVADD